MRRHITMEQLAHDVLSEARTAVNEKVASTSPSAALQTDVGVLLHKLASEIRSSQYADLTYADIAAAVEARRGQR